MLMNAHDRSVDHLSVSVISLRDRVQNSGPGPSLALAIDVVVAGGIGPVALRKVVHGAPELSIQKIPFNTRRPSARGTLCDLSGCNG